MMGIHCFDSRLRTALKNLDKSDISSVNEGYLLDFVDYLKASGMSKPRIERYIYTIKDLSILLGKDFKALTKKDVVHLIGEVESRDYSVHTKNVYKVMLKRFVTWLLDADKPPSIVSWLRTERKRANVLPEELLTQLEVKEMISHSKNPRDKAFIACLYESGCRVGEMGNLLVKHVSFDKHGGVLMVNGKTGQRRVRLINSVPYLADWLNHHPLRDDSSSALWVSLPPNKPSMISYSTIRKILKVAAKRAGVKKRVNPHAFRHARATHLASHLTEAQMKEYLGWVQDSSMASTYIHLSGRDVDKALLKMNGVEFEEKEERGELSLIKCSRCSHTNKPTNKYCGKCGLVLNVKDALELEKQKNVKDKLLNQLINDPEVKKLLIEKAKLMNNG